MSNTYFITLVSKFSLNILYQERSIVVRFYAHNFVGQLILDIVYFFNREFGLFDESYPVSKFELRIKDSIKKGFLNKDRPLSDYNIKYGETLELCISDHY